MNPNVVHLERDTLLVKDGESYIAFSPFQQNITRVYTNPNEEPIIYRQLQELGFFQEPPQTTRKIEKWNGFSSITLLLTRQCNLGCSYCYASAKPIGPSIPLDFAIKATDWFLRQLKLKTIRTTFHGGGEPTLEQDTIIAVVNLIETNKGEKETKYLITTNGTAPKDFTDWMMEKRFGISISMDGPPDIQDRNRPLAGGGNSSAIVEETVRYLVSSRYPFSIRMTYSATDDITRTFEYFASLGVKLVHLEPLFPHGREYNTVAFGKRSGYEVYSPTGGELLSKFLEALDASKRLGMKIYNGHITHFTRGIGYFCGAASGQSMIITHDKHLSGCLEVIDTLDQDAKTFIYGRWVKETDKFVIDGEKILMMQNRHSDTLPECKTCYARYHCAGGCSVKAVRATKDFFERDLPYCVFTRALVPVLVKRIAVESGI